MTIKGKVVYQNIGMGFWGITDNSGKNWLPVNMPPELQKEGKSVELRAQTVEMEGAAMWGTPIEVVSWDKE